MYFSLGYIKTLLSQIFKMKQQKQVDETEPCALLQ
jgi:hypothetical protein